MAMSLSALKLTSSSANSSSSGGHKKVMSDREQEVAKGDMNGNMMGDKDSQSEFGYRQYQVDLIDRAIRENIILCLPTGSGKTFIALKVTEHMLAEKKGKKVIFLATSVPLVKQQTEFFRKHLPSACGVISITGDMGIDSYDQKDWAIVLATHDVLVMSVKLLTTALNHQSISWQNISLLILDECHNATGDHEMVKVMDLYKQCYHNGSSRDVPRVLGLTATVVKGGTSKATVAKIQKEINGLQERLCCRAVTHPNFEEILKFSTSAKVNLVQLTRQLFSSSDRFCEELNKVIELMAKMQDPLAKENNVTNNVGHHTLRSALQVYNHKNTINENMTKIMVDVIDIYTELGPYCASIAAIFKQFQVRKHMDEVKVKLGGRAKDHKAIKLLNIAHSSLVKFQHDINLMMENEYKKRKSESNLVVCFPGKNEFILKAFKSEKIEKVLNILNLKSPAVLNESEEPLCGLLFCEKRFTTQMLNWYFQDLSKHCPKYEFLKVDFILGGASKGLDIEESQSVSKRQSEVLERFRRKELNLIIATAVLEEGLDVPSCNTIIRFNQIKNYPSYIQSMGRARMKNAKFYVLIPKDSDEEERRKIETYDDFNASLASTLAEKLDSIVDEEFFITQPSEPTIPTFCPGGTVDSPRLTETDVIHSVYRYCALLKADGLSTPVPVSWCVEIAGGYKAYLLLPSNSPIRDAIEGDVLGNKVLAKRSVFRKACELLYEAGELNDYLLPRREDKENFENEFLKGLAAESEKRKKDGGPKLGTKKSTELYEKSMPLTMLCAPITAATDAVLFKIELSFEKQGTDCEKLSYRYDFNKHPYSFGLLVTNELILNEVPAFHLQTPAGLIKVTLTKQSKLIKLSKRQLDLLVGFQSFLAKFIYGLQLEGRLDKKNAEVLVVAMEKNEIAWGKMEELDAFDLKTYCKPPTDKKNFRFDEKSYVDTIVVPWYRPLQTNDPNMFWVSEVSKNLTSNSRLQSKYGKSYIEHYKNRWLLEVSNPSLPLLLCHAVGAQRNFLWCQRAPANATASRGGSLFEFPPEMVNISPIPASILLQGIYIMSILHRINRLIGALLIQQAIGVKFDWDVSRNLNEENFDENLKGRNRKKPGDWTNKIDQESSSSKCNPDENIQENGLNIAGIDYTDPRSLSWDQVEGFVKRQNLLKENMRHSSHNRRNRVVPTAPPPDSSKWTEDLISVNGIKSNFDSKTDFRRVAGPSVFRIMEALTLANANDYMSLELLETKGDAVLKWINSTHIFSNFPIWKEGRMTSVRTRLICNEHLCAVARKRRIGNHLAGSIFKQDEWIPPGFGETKQQQIVLAVDSEDDENGNKTKFKLMPPLSHYEISDKSIADSAEALLGAYYSDGGLDSALRFMEWFGLEGPCAGIDNKTYSSRPYSRDISFTVPKHAFIQSSTFNGLSPYELVPYLKELEKTISYEFKTKWLIVEALTHPTYLRNRVTQSYQRLEFLGDAVLDFLITCYIIDHTGIVCPGRVTDLRSALVNNVTFGCLSTRYGFNRFLLHSCEKLHNKISTFAEFQQKQGNQVIDPYLLMSDKDAILTQNVDIPKALGDIFEAITGAIYVDSNYSLDTVWKVVYRLMKPEIDAFSENIPVNPVRKVMEMFPGKVLTEDIDLGESGADGDMCVEMRIKDTTLRARGVGTRKKLAKEAAAKQLLRTLVHHPKQKSSFTD